MPTFTKVREVDSETVRERIPYASEEEVLAFANRVRELGGADVIEAFMPSTPGVGNICLIANALNFSCRIVPEEIREGYHLEEVWRMWFPKNFSSAEITRIADALDCETVSFGDKVRCIQLPRLIGNAADAFDYAAQGWVVKYRNGPRVNA